MPRFVLHPKVHIITLRLTSQELENLKLLAHVQGKSRSETLRELIPDVRKLLGDKIKQRDANSTKRLKAVRALN